jgi:hypothetical protein
MSESVMTVHFQIQSLQTLEHLLEYPSGGIRVKTTLDRAIHVRTFHMILASTNADNTSY